MTLKEKFIELIEKRKVDFSDENVTALESFIASNTIKFTKYFDNPNGYNPRSSTFNMTGNFEGFETNSVYPEGTLIKIKYASGELFYVQVGDVFFD